MSRIAQRARMDAYAGQALRDAEWNRNMDALKQSLADYSEACRKIADLNARTADQLAELLSPAELAGARGEPK